MSVIWTAQPRRRSLISVNSVRGREVASGMSTHTERFPLVRKIGLMLHPSSCDRARMAPLMGSSMALRSSG